MNNNNNNKSKNRLFLVGCYGGEASRRRCRSLTAYYVILVLLVVGFSSPSSSSNLFCCGFFKSSSSSNNGFEKLPNLLSPTPPAASISNLRITVNDGEKKKKFVLRRKVMITLEDLQEQIEKKLGNGIEISNHRYDCRLLLLVRGDDGQRKTVIATPSHFVKSNTYHLIDDLGLTNGDELHVSYDRSYGAATEEEDFLVAIPTAPRSVSKIQFTIQGKHYTIPHPITTVYELRKWIHILSGIQLSKQGDIIGCSTNNIDYTNSGGYREIISLGINPRKNKNNNKGYHERYRLLDQLGINDGETFHCVNNNNNNSNSRRKNRLHRLIDQKRKEKQKRGNRGNKIQSSVLPTGSTITMHKADIDDSGATFLCSGDDDPSSLVQPSFFDSSSSGNGGDEVGGGMPTSFHDIHNSLWNKVTKNNDKDPTERKKEVQKMLDTIQTESFQKYCTNRETIEAMRNFFVSPNNPFATTFFSSLPTQMKDKMNDKDTFYDMITESMEQLSELNVDELIDVIDKADEQRQQQQQQQQKNKQNQEQQQNQQKQQVDRKNTNDERTTTATTTTIPEGRPPTLRFQLNQRVKCNMGKEYGWRKGRINKLWMEVNTGRWVPYGIDLDEGGGTFAPNDHDETICALTDTDNDTNNKKSSPPMMLRFTLNQRVECNMGEKDGWRRGRVSKLWMEVKKGRWVPYGIELDNDGGNMYAPIDHDDTIRAIVAKDDQLVEHHNDSDWWSDGDDTEGHDVFEDVITSEVLSSILGELSESEDDLI